MKTKIFAIHDAKVGSYMQPFFMQSAGQALRSWGTSINDPSTLFCTHPADFTLFELGTYDDETGMVLAHEIKINLGTALELKTKPVVEESLYPKTVIKPAPNTLNGVQQHVS